MVIGMPNSRSREIRAVFDDLEANVSNFPMGSTKPTCLSCDLESEYNSSKFSSARLVDRLLRCLDQHDVKITFFVEGKLIPRYRSLWGEIQSAGHEIQLHCWDHSLPGLCDDIDTSKKVFEDALGFEPRGYRAKSYRITAELIYRLIEEGFWWDSSLLFGRGIGRTKVLNSFREADVIGINQGAFKFIPVTSDPNGCPDIYVYRGLANSLQKWDSSGKRFTNLVFHLADIERPIGLWQSSLSLAHRIGYEVFYARTRGGFDVFDEMIGSAKKRNLSFLTIGQVASSAQFL